MSLHRNNVEYLLINDISVCYSSDFVANVFMRKEIAYVTETHVAYSEPLSTLDSDPQYWYTKCTQSLLLKVHWFGNNVTESFLSHLRAEGMVEVCLETRWPADPWRVLPGNLEKFHFNHSLVLVNHGFYDPGFEEDTNSYEARCNEEDEQRDKYLDLREAYNDFSDGDVDHDDDDDDEGEHFVEYLEEHD